MYKFDIFQPVGPKDISIINKSLKVNKKNLKGYDKIFLLSETKSLKVEGCNLLDPSFFPFSLEYIKNNMYNKQRAGWVYAQLVKLYYPQLQKNKEYVLVIDSDVFFTKPIEFFDKETKPIFTTSNEYHIPYFEHMNRLHPDLMRSHKKSGISHHMLFSKKILTALFDKVEKYSRKKFYDHYIQTLDSNENSPSADYEIYFHYILKYHKEKYSIREMNWKNVSLLTFKDFKNFRMISLPHYAGTRPKNFVTNIKKSEKIRAAKSLYNFFFLTANNILNYLK